jgi:L-gulonolactone oxidase
MSEIREYLSLAASFLYALLWALPGLILFTIRSLISVVGLTIESVKGVQVLAPQFQAAKAARKIAVLLGAGIIIEFVTRFLPWGSTVPNPIDSFVRRRGADAVEAALLDLALPTAVATAIVVLAFALLSTGCFVVVAKKAGFPVDNWSQEQNFRLGEVDCHTPTSVSEIQSIVRRARVERRTVKVVGAGYSWSDIAVPRSRGVLLSLDKMASLVSVDMKRAQVTVEGGMRLRVLSRELAEHGLMLINLTSVHDQSIAGALATGVHGTGTNYQSLSNHLLAAQVVDGTGKVHDYSRTTHPTELSCIATSLGALGVVTRVTLQVTPLTRYHERQYTTHLSDRFYEELPALSAAADHVKFWVQPDTGVVHVFLIDRTTEPARDRLSLARTTFDILALECMQYVASWSPRRLTLPLMRLAMFFGFPAVDRVEEQHRTLVIPHRIAVHSEAEWAVDAHVAPDVLRSLMASLRANSFPVGHIVEVRFVKGDSLPLSPETCESPETTTFATFTQLLSGRSAEDTYFYFRLLEDIVVPLGGRPHWAKTHHLRSDQIRALYPREKWETWTTVRRSLDPDGVFTNDWLERTFGSDASPSLSPVDPVKKVETPSTPMPRLVPVSVKVEEPEVVSPVVSPAMSTPIPLPRTPVTAARTAPERSLRLPITPASPGLAIL